MPGTAAERLVVVLVPYTVWAARDWGELIRMKDDVAEDTELMMSVDIEVVSNQFEPEVHMKAACFETPWWYLQRRLAWMHLF